MLFCAILALVNYLPAFTDNSGFPPIDTAPQAYNLSSLLYNRVLKLPIQSFWDAENTQLYWEWYTTKELLFKGQLPLWRYDTQDGGRPLLAISQSPLFYPPLLIYYLTASSPWLAVFHLWLGLCSMWLLSCRLLVTPKTQRYKYVPIVIMFILLSALRPDFEAALAWLPLAMWLPLSKFRRVWQLLGLALVEAMLLLAVNPPTSLILVGLVFIWVFLSLLKIKVHQSFWQALIQTAIPLLLGLMLAAPQMLPHAFDPLEAYQHPSDINQLIFDTATGTKLLNLKRVSETQVDYTFAVSPQASQLTFVIPERYAQGWTAQYSTDPNLTTFAMAQLEKTSEGWRKLTLPLVHTTNVMVQTNYKPQTFLIGLYCAGLALLIIVVTAVVVWGSYLKKPRMNQPE
jgi:hypothetical protein